MKLTERVSYLQGLMDGLEINDSTKEGKVLIKIVDILQELALSMEDLEEEIDEVVELVDILDEDLGEIEEELFDYDDDEDDDSDEFDDDEEMDMDEEFFEVICPTCGDTICLNEEMIEEGSIDCPNCGEKLEFDFDEEETTTE